MQNFQSTSCLRVLENVVWGYGARKDLVSRRAFSRHLSCSLYRAEPGLSVCRMTGHWGNHRPLGQPQATEITPQSRGGGREEDPLLSHSKPDIYGLTMINGGKTPPHPPPLQPTHVLLAPSEGCAIKTPQHPDVQPPSWRWHHVCSKQSSKYNYGAGTVVTS